MRRAGNEVERDDGQQTRAVLCLFTRDLMFDAVPYSSPSIFVIMEIYTRTKETQEVSRKEARAEEV